MANIDKITLRGVNYPIIDSSVPAYVRGITQADITNWNNKLDTFTETDPTIPSYVRGITQANITNWNNKLDSFTETDPTVPSYVKGITESDITNWNNKLSEHQDLSSYVTREDLSAAGYLTSYTETDPTVPSYVKTIKQTDITNWNSKTDNVGTITGITMNGSSKGTSGVVNLGTVITSETRLSKGTTTGNGNAVTDISVSNHQITLTKGKTFLESFTETDPIYSASAAAGITASDISNWNSKTSNVGTITGINMNGASKGTSGVIDLGTVLTEHQSLASYANAIEYNSSEKKIYLKHDNTTLGNPINATDFIKDGMVDTAYVQGSNLVISFNTDAGKQPVQVPITDIFNASNYYTKTEINNAAYLQSETDPVYSASAAAGITSSDITNWNNKTSNTGTITGITMNSTSKGTSGVVDLGTVITSETQLSKGTATGSGNAVTDISVSNHQITLTKGKTFIETETDPIYSASAAAGITSSDITNWNNKTSNTGTITGINMNGASKGTSGVVDLGTVITSETQLSKGSTSGSGNAVTDISVSNHQITLTKGKTFIETETQLSKGTTTGSGNAVTDISVSNHQITLTKGSTFLTSETDPVYSASAAAGITSAMITNWNSYTANTGTITGITMNGVSKGTSGVVNLGTVVTDVSDKEDEWFVYQLTDSVDNIICSNFNSSTDEFIYGYNVLVEYQNQIYYYYGKRTVSMMWQYIWKSVDGNDIISTQDGSTWTSNHEQTLLQVNPDWNETDPSELSYIFNKPTIPTGLPSVTSSDNGKVLQVVNGVWTLVSPVTLYSGSGTPNNAQGNNGDIYLQI